MNQNNQTNSTSILSLTLGILSFLIPFIGLVVGILGIVFSKKATKEIMKSNEAGKGLAISGLICSLVGIIIQLFIILAFLTYKFFTIVG